MKMKQILAVVLSAAMVFGLAACGNNTTAETTTSTETASVDTTAEPTEAPEAEVAEEEHEPITLRMAWWGSQTRHDRTIAVIELYLRNHRVRTHGFRWILQQTCNLGSI